MCQHGWKRIVLFNVSDINTTTLTIDPNLVKVVADTYNGQSLNSPNDLVLSFDDDSKRILCLQIHPLQGSTIQMKNHSLTCWKG